jgi:hypothetical protein
MPKPRPKYKQLYQEAMSLANQEKGRADNLRHRLAHINKSLASFGRRTLMSYGECEDISIAIGLLPHEYVSVEAFMETDLRYTASEADDYYYGFKRLTWRGRPIGWLGEQE